MKILIVDDDFINRKVLQKLSSKYGESHIAVNGKEAVEVAKDALEADEPYDLILLDIMMPKLTGSEALKQIRKIETDSKIAPGHGSKIIMITSIDENKKILQAFTDQCDGYIVKPANEESFTTAMINAGAI